MCVIAVVHDEASRPTLAELNAMWEQNSDGMGAAWFEGGELRWEKGMMDKGEALRFVKTIPVPFVVHFRLTSVGGTHPSLTHPFPISEDVSLALSGRSIVTPVIFHNGHWSKWGDLCMQYAGTGGYRIPGGKWSDTRGIALTAHHYGEGFLEMLDEKIALLDPTKQGDERITLFSSRGWEVHDNRFIVSNRVWLSKLPTPVVEVKESYWTKWRASSSPQQQSLPPAIKAIIEGKPVMDDPPPQQRPQGGDPIAPTPFGLPLSFYETLLKNGRLSQKHFQKIRKYFDRIVRHPGTGSQKPKVMSLIEAKEAHDRQYRTLH